MKLFLDAACAASPRESVDVTTWVNAHNMALYKPTINERGIADMLRGWYNYATAHEERFDSKIGADYVLGPAWFQIGSALLRLLNGDLGRLDGGTLDKFIRQTMLDNGFEQKMIDDA